MPEETAPGQLKHWFDEARHRSLAQELGQLQSAFNDKQFLQTTLTGMEARSLMERLHWCSVAVDAALPGTYREKVAILRLLAPKIGHSFVAIFLCDFVATFGVADFAFSLEALRFFTCFGSAEFAVRAFITAHPDQTLRVMSTWASDANEHVRRLASEGSRPRLPWGTRLTLLIREPHHTAEILEKLRHDPSLYVRRSVANHLNDIAKDHPGYVLQLLESWDLSSDNMLWIAKHACRSLIKRGEARALKLFGFGSKARVSARLHLGAAKLYLGQRLQLNARLISSTPKPQRLAIDYVIHFVKASGGTSEKVFKWKELDLPGGAEQELSKSQVIKDFTTRKHYPGVHRVEIQINGQRMADAIFELIKF